MNKLDIFVVIAINMNTFKCMHITVVVNDVWIFEILRLTMISRGISHSCDFQIKFHCIYMSHTWPYSDRSSILSQLFNLRQWRQIILSYIEFLSPQNTNVYQYYFIKTFHFGTFEEQVLFGIPPHCDVWMEDDKNMRCFFLSTDRKSIISIYREVMRMPHLIYTHRMILETMIGFRSET